jgi:signal transduction histidine kinase
MASQSSLSAGRAQSGLRGPSRENLLEAQDEILALLDSGARLDAVLERIAREIDRFIGTSCCAIALIDPDRGTHRIAAAPNLAHGTREALERDLAANAPPPEAAASFGNVRALEHGAAGQSQRVRWYALAARNGRNLGAIVLHGDRSEDGGADTDWVRSFARLARIAIETDHSAAALRLANERFAALAASVPGVVYQRRVDPSGEIRYTYISEGARDLFGVSAEEILADPKALFNCHGPSYRENFRQRLLEASKTLTIWDVEAEIIARDGKRKWTHAIARPKRLPDGAVLWDGIILDATRIARREHQLRAEKDQAELANRGKSEFIATMSHELRTPLNAIIGFSEIMEQELLGPLGSAMYKDYSRDILESGKHLLSIINDVLDISKIEAGKLQLNEDEVDLAVVVASVLRLVRERAEAAGVAISSKMDSALPAVRADERLLKQILSNLMSNAIKFTPKGGSAIIIARMVTNGIVLSVKDTGIGMTAEQIPRAMERFGQVDNSLSRRFEGTGLGLPLVKAFTELHGGTFAIESEFGVGTTAIVRLPASRIVQRRQPA